MVEIDKFVSVEIQTSKMVSRFHTVFKGVETLQANLS
jgi:hypothetical protein